MNFLNMQICTLLQRVDQLFDDVGTLGRTASNRHRWTDTQILGIGQLANKIDNLRAGEKLGRLFRSLVRTFLDRCIVQVVQAVTQTIAPANGCATTKRLTSSQKSKLREYPQLPQKKAVAAALTSAKSLKLNCALLEIQYRLFDAAQTTG